MIIEQLKQPGPFLILSLFSQTIKVLFHLLGFPTEVHLATSNSIFLSCACVFCYFATNSCCDEFYLTPSSFQSSRNFFLSVTLFWKNRSVADVFLQFPGNSSKHKKQITSSNWRVHLPCCHGNVYNLLQCIGICLKIDTDSELISSWVFTF